ncbi:hypothetical protein AB0H49_34115 [Nocardia sp. NPDC050713]|uniref:hypothetical protein n=1 Tax=Nocardia sp. NPDC050713 TaxID=3154511 RepID=UPI0033E86181
MNLKAPIPFALTAKGKRVIAFHPIDDQMKPSPWDCADAGPLTVAESAEVLTTHGQCGSECRISRTARKVRARLIDAPTVRAHTIRIR